MTLSEMKRDGCRAVVDDGKAAQRMKKPAAERMMKTSNPPKKPPVVKKPTAIAIISMHTSIVPYFEANRK